MKIFLGYPSEQTEIARTVVKALKSSGHEIWFDKECLLPGVDWDRERANAQNTSDMIVHICSPEMETRSGVVHREIKQSLRLVEDQPFGSIFLVFIRTSDFRLPVELTRFQYIDMFAPNWQKRLIESVTERAAQLNRPLREQNRQEQHTTVDRVHSVKHKISEISETFECFGTYVSFEETDLYWHFINSKIASHVLSEFIACRINFIEFSNDQDVLKNMEGRKYYSECNTEVFFHSSEFISARFYSFIDSGGAHPSHHITTLNFFGKEFGIVEIESLLAYDIETARKILKFCEKSIAALNDDVDQDDFFEMYSDNDDNVWRLLHQFSFDRRGITFNFSPYDVLPFVFGSHEVFAPWNYLNEFFDPKYRRLIETISENRT